MSSPLPTGHRGPLSWLLISLLAGCAAMAGYNGHGLIPGQSREAEVRASMGEPALVYPLADGGQVLFYPRGPQGYHTFRVTLDETGRLVAIANVLTSSVFAQIQAGQDRETVRRTLGPPRDITPYARRHEEVWEWRFCNDFSDSARFYVIFDQPTGLVKSTGQLTEGQLHWRGGRIPCSR